MAHTIVVAGFPGTGKSHFVNGDYVPDGFALDSDSSKFDKERSPSLIRAMIKLGVTILKGLIIGFVNLTNIFIKKKLESSL